MTVSKSEPRITNHQPQSGQLASMVLRQGIRRLTAGGIEHARQEAEWLLGRLVGARPLELYLDEPPIPAQAAEQFFAQLEARASGAPLQYLLGEAEFFGRPFAVEPGVFIPRPETEAIAEAAIRQLRVLEATRGRALRVADLGTGSGCIALTLAHALPACVVVRVEVSWWALRVASQNVRRHGLSDRVCLIQGSWTAPLRFPVDALVSNPPYIPTARVEEVPRDVRQEPRLSLDGGPDGMRDLLQLMAEAPRVLQPGGLLVMECGEEHVERLQRASVSACWQAAEPLHDLAGRPRGLLLKKR